MNRIHHISLHYITHMFIYKNIYVQKWRVSNLEYFIVFYRGEGKNNDEAFRDYFSKIGQLRSLSLNVSILSLTATASPTNRKRIMKSLAFRENNVVIIDSPDRPNIKINVKCVKNNSDISETCSWLIDKITLEKKNLERHVVFCESIKDWALLYSMFIRTGANRQIILRRKSVLIWSQGSYQYKCCWNGRELWRSVQCCTFWASTRPRHPCTADGPCRTGWQVLNGINLIQKSKELTATSFP